MMRRVGLIKDLWAGASGASASPGSMCEGCLVPRTKCGGSGLVKHDQVVVGACPGVTRVFAAASARTG